MSEHQKHGFAFEDWIRKTFTSNEKAPYTAEWDIEIPRYKGQYSNHTLPYNGLPVSIKACRFGASIGLGDALRQFRVPGDFLLIVGFWSKGTNVKKFVSVAEVKIIHKDWKQLFAPVVTPEELNNDRMKYEEVERRIKNLDTLIKDRSLNYKEARKRAKEEKALFPPMEISLNQKIDSKNQRRLQCSLPFNTFWTKFAKKSSGMDENCEFWGEKVPELK